MAMTGSVPGIHLVFTISSTGTNFGLSMAGMPSLPTPPDLISPRSTDCLEKSVSGHWSFHSTGLAIAVSEKMNSTAMNNPDATSAQCRRTNSKYCTACLIVMAAFSASAGAAVKQRRITFG